MDLDTVRLGLGWFLFWIWTFLVFVGLDLDGFFWIWIFLVFSLGLDLDGFSFSTGSWFFSDLDLFGLQLDWIGLVFLRKWIFRFSVGFGSQTVFSKSS
jgi:hypothetical protein